MIPVWSTTFDNQNRPLTQTDPLGNIRTLAYDSVGNQIVAMNPLGYRTSWTFNVFDKPVSMQNALGAFWTSVYDALGQPIVSIDPLGNRSTQVFDAASRPIASINPLGFASSTIYPRSLVAPLFGVTPAVSFLDKQGCNITLSFRIVTIAVGIGASYWAKVSLLRHCRYR